jgi:hypothetical protein
LTTSRFQLARQGFQRRLQRGLREAVERRPGDRPAADQGQLGCAHPVLVGDLGELRQRQGAGGGNLRQRRLLLGGDRGQRRALALHIAVAADLLDLVGGVHPLGPRRGEGDLAGGVEHRVEAEFLPLVRHQ